MSRAPLPAAVLQGFRALATSGKVASDFDCGPVVAKAGHPDGWGIAAWSAEGEVFQRAAVSAAGDGGFDRAAKEAAALPAPVVCVAHVRRVLDPTLVAEEHTLPFRREVSGVVRYFAWDGQIEKFGLQAGGTDARWVWESLHGRLGDAPGPKQLGAAVRQIREEGRARFPKRLTSLSLLVSDGSRLLAHRDGGTCPLYFALHLGTTKDAVLVASEVLPVPGAEWRFLRNGESVAVAESLKVSTG